jgi:cation transport regulator
VQLVETPWRLEAAMLSMENLPQEVRENLPQEAQKLYIAAYNSFFENSKSEEAAARVAWQTISLNEHYYQSEDGKWHRQDDDGVEHHGPLGVMPHS